MPLVLCCIACTSLLFSDFASTYSDRASSVQARGRSHFWIETCLGAGGWKQVVAKCASEPLVARRSSPARGEPSRRSPLAASPAIELWRRPRNRP